jgi:exoribonuclease-2
MVVIMKYNEELELPIKPRCKQDADIVTGEVIEKEGGYGFLSVSKTESYFIPPQQMSKVIHGDIIEAKLTESNSGKKIAVPEKVINTSYDEFIGRIKVLDTGCYLYGKEPMQKRLFKVSSNKLSGYENGDWVNCRLSGHPIHSGLAKASIANKIASNDDPMAPWKVVIARNKLCDLDLSYSSQNEELTNDIESDYEDLTHLPFITIDSESTREMDDAVHCQKTSYGFIVNVAIADVSYFIKGGLTLDEIAMQRATTTYLPSKSIPMLPRELSEDSCSLSEGNERRTLCCAISFNNNGKMINFDFKMAKIKSVLKASYDDVSKGISNDLLWTHGQETLLQINILHEVSNKIRNLRSKKSFITSYDNDCRFVFDAKMQPVDIVPVDKGVSQSIIEELMISTNICAAKFLKKHNLPGLFIENTGVDKKLLSEMTARSEGEFIPEHDLHNLNKYHMALKSLHKNDMLELRQTSKRSKVTEKPSFHYGMGLSEYATITSPIRKYTDLHNQRLIKSILLGNKVTDNISGLADLLNLGIVKASNAKNEIRQWLFLEFYGKNIGKTVFCTINDIDKMNVYLSPVENDAQIILGKNSITCFKSIDCITKSVLLEEGQSLSVGEVIEAEITAVNAQALKIYASH